MKLRLRGQLAASALRTIALGRLDWREVFVHVAQGTHSGIPACCITFFVLEWIPWEHAFGPAARGIHPHRLALEMAGITVGNLEPPEYVPCPDCLARRHFVEIHTCTKECFGKPGCSPLIERMVRNGEEA